MKRFFFVLLFVVCLVGCQEGKRQATKTADEPIRIAVKATEQEEVVQLSISLTNPNDHDVTVTYPSSQRFQAQIMDVSQRVIYDFAKEQVFTQAIEKDTFAKKEVKRYTIEVPLPSSTDASEVRVTTIRQFKGSNTKQTTDRQSLDSK